MKTIFGDTKGSRMNASRRRLVVLTSVAIALASLIAFTYGRTAAGSELETDLINDTPTQDFSRFRHDTAQHTRLPCLVCHVRSDNSSTPKMPGHIPCASCHSQQFAEGNTNAICTICHTATDVNGKRREGRRVVRPLIGIGN
ncbi:MAG: cytochrome c3 family protein, partial [Acidobacteriota bacterium]